LIHYIPCTAKEKLKYFKIFSQCYTIEKEVFQMNKNCRWSVEPGRIGPVILLGVLAFCMVFPGCTSGDGCLCTDVFMIQIVQVVDQTGSPLDGVTVTVTFTDSGLPVDCSQYHDMSSGQYCIFNDNYVDQLTEEALPISVSYEKPGFVTRIELYYFNTDACRCHINLLGGETRVVLLEGCSGMTGLNRSEGGE
jgi:hypothetical protein